MFQSILAEVISRVPGAIAAVFLDREGETIEYAATEVSKHDARIFGAYVGIFLARASRLAEGSPARMKIEWERLTAMAVPLRDGYFLVLLMRRPYVETVAVRELLRAGTTLSSEI